MIQIILVHILSKIATLAKHFSIYKPSVSIIFTLFVKISGRVGREALWRSYIAEPLPDECVARGRDSPAEGFAWKSRRSDGLPHLFLVF